MTLDIIILKNHNGVLVKAAICIGLILVLAPPTSAHGRLLDPPSRQSAWRFGFHTPANYDDHGRNCGGRENQWDYNDGRCGLCGDPAEGPLWYERPDGIMVQHDVITRNYSQGQTIDVRVDMTVNHWGWFEFRICDIATTGGIEATQECLDTTLLADATDSTKTRFEVLTDAIGFYDYRLALPSNLVCQHCMLQWKWKCGNSPGYGEQQEEFYACSDISIHPENGVIPTVVTTATTVVTPGPTSTVPATTQTTASTTTTKSLTTTVVKTLSPVVTRPDTTSASSSTPLAIIDNDGILGYFQNQATKKPSGGNAENSPPPRPKQPSQPGVPDTSVAGHDNLCTICLGNGCRFAGCDRMCPNVCS